MVHIPATMSQKSGDPPVAVLNEPAGQLNDLTGQHLLISRVSRLISLWWTEDDPAPCRHVALRTPRPFITWSTHWGRWEELRNSLRRLPQYLPELRRPSASVSGSGSSDVGCEPGAARTDRLVVGTSMRHLLNPLVGWTVQHRLLPGMLVRTATEPEPPRTCGRTAESDPFEGRVSWRCYDLTRTWGRTSRDGPFDACW